MQEHRVHWPTLSWWHSLSAGMASRGMPAGCAVHNFSASRSHLAEDPGVHWQSCSHTPSSSHCHDPRPQRHESQHRQGLPSSEHSGLSQCWPGGAPADFVPCFSVHCSHTVMTSRLCSELWCCFNCLCFLIPPPGLGAGAWRGFWTAQLMQEGTFPRVAHTQCVLCSGQKLKIGSTHWARKIIPSFGAWKEKESLWKSWAPVPELFLEN